MVPHRGTNWAALWLTAQIGRDAVLSESYGRGYTRSANANIYVARSIYSSDIQRKVILNALMASTPAFRSICLFGVQQ